MSKDAASDPDFGLVMASAVSYVIGRRSYAVPAVVDFVKSHWKAMQLDDRSLIMRSVKTALQRNDVSHNVRMWQTFLKWMEGNG